MRDDFRENITARLSNRLSLGMALGTRQAQFAKLQFTLPDFL